MDDRRLPHIGGYLSRGVLVLFGIIAVALGSGEPVSNGAREIWVTETALTTALHLGFMAEMLSIFSIVTGVTLVLARKAPPPAAGAAP